MVLFCIITLAGCGNGAGTTAVTPPGVLPSRHTAATLLLSQGTNPKVVQEMLGHSRVSMTLDTYSNVTPSLQGGAAEAMDAMLA